MISANFLDSLKIKPQVTNTNENGIKIIIQKKQPITNEDEEKEDPDAQREEKKTTQILKELVDDGDRAIEIANKIKENKLTKIKKSIKPSLVETNLDFDRMKETKVKTNAEGTIKKSRKQSDITKKTMPFHIITTNAVYNLIDKNLMVNNKKLIDRIPLPPPEFIRVPNYVMNNRLSFYRFVNDILLKKYKDQIENDTETTKITCDDLSSGSSKSGLMLHQQLVRDYLNLVTPYRGLLLYHGLGSGKTCSSIAIAEGMKDTKKVIVMLPASLQRNYIEEIKKCGDPIFKRNQYWEWIQVSQDNEELIKNLSIALSLSEDYIKKQRGVWITNISKSSNISRLNADELKSLNIQLDIMIKNKYEFINYNGLRKERFRSITNNYTTNIFDNSVVIIDEAHNLISRIVNKIGKLKDTSKSRRTLKKDTINRGIESADELSLQMYHMLMMANNSKIILLTGTPIINYPIEIGILFNILRGYIKTWTFNLRPAPGTTTIIDESKLKNHIFSTNKILDFLSYTPTSQRLTITRNPFGFENVIKENRYDHDNENKYKYDGVSNVPAKKKDSEGKTYIKERKIISDEEFQQNVINVLRANDITAVFEELKYNTALPDKLEDFLFNFIDINNPGKMKNEMKFKKRIIGLTSYFRSAQEELLPRYDKNVDRIIVKIPMSDSQFNIYSEYRKKERKTETNMSQENNPGNLFKQQSSTYRIMSRLACNLTLPNRPNPMDYRKNRIIEEEEEKQDEKQEKDEERKTNVEVELEKKEKQIKKSQSTKKKGVKFVTDDDVINIPKSNMITVAEETLNEKLANLTLDKKETILKSISDFENSSKIKFDKMDEKNKIKMLNLFEKYANKINKNEITKSFTEYYQDLLSKKSKKGGGLFKLFMKGGIDSDEELVVEENTKQELEEQGEDLQENAENEDNVVIEEPDIRDIDDEIESMTTNNYKIDQANFMRNLRENVTTFLSMSPISDGDNIPLMIHGPKYYEIIKNITSEEHVGLHLLYSQFRNMEGLDIFSMALDVNGFSRFRLSKNSEGYLEVDESTLTWLNDGKQCYAMYTGEETPDERELTRKIFNGDWNEIPQNIRLQLEEISNANMNGEIIKLLMITSAGAEGINLRNTRYVHIMEPYWHPVRTEQVIGRARRICSHSKLSEELQTVQVFIYISVFTQEQLDSDFASDIMRLDKSPIAPFKPESSDEKLLRISNIKEAISEVLLKSAKETSIDCITYSTTNEDKEGLKCLAFNSAKIEDFSYVPSYDDQQQDADIPLGQIRRNVDFQRMTLKDGTQYMLKTDTNELYDPRDIEEANPMPIGRLVTTSIVNADGKKIPSGKSSIQFYKKSSVIDESGR